MSTEPAKYEPTVSQERQSRQLITRLMKRTRELEEQLAELELMVETSHQLASTGKYRESWASLNDDDFSFAKAPHLILDEAVIHQRAIEAKYFRLTGRSEHGLRPKAGFGAYTLCRKPVVVIGVSMVGLPEDQIGLAVTKIAREQNRRRDFVPVILTDGVEVGPIIEEGYVFEFLKPSRFFGDGASDAEERDYLVEKVLFLWKKWEMERIIFVFENSNLENYLRKI